MPLQPELRKKTYSPPKLSKLTPDQANLTLIGHASCGDQGAKDREKPECLHAFRGRKSC